MFAGGIADKLGNRYEAKWLVRQLLDVIGGRAQSLRFEGISDSFRGFEFAIRRAGRVEWHQTKINNPNGNWTIGALQREGVLSAFKTRLSADANDLCVFVSQDPAKDISALAEKAKIASNAKEYEEALGDGHAAKFDELQRVWAVDAQIAFSWLKRSHFKTESQSAIESVIVTFSDFYFFKAGDSAFEALREFLETRINKEITTENSRSDLRSDGKLVLKDWSIDPTLRERLSKETSAYLETYIPFGAGGSKISRAEASHLVDRAASPSGPRVILLTGVAGSGKSGVIREFIEQLTELDIPHLALRIDQHLNCSSPKSLGKAVTDRDESPVATLKGVAPDQLSVLIIDQVDAVSEVSGRNGIVKQAVVRLVDDARNFGGIVLVIACRTFDLESDQRLKALKDAHNVEHVNVPLLTWESEVKPLLLTKSIDMDTFTEKQRELLCLPLNLAIFLETFDGTEPEFKSRNDLFARLLERKGRSIRPDRQVAWELVAPLSKLAEWMSGKQRLDAPEDILSEFGGAIDILSSEGLVVRSRGHVNFFHESFFDYMYARTFASQQQSLESLLVASEQHLFRRTQVRQILETLRQVDMRRYLQEMQTVLASGNVRYHVKVAIAQWLGSLSDPLKEEADAVLALDTTTSFFPPLVRYALFNSPGWFDRLFQDGWVLANLTGPKPERVDGILGWLSDIAGQRPAEVAGLLDQWWGETPDRGKRLLDWFGFVKRQMPDDALVDLCCRITRSNPLGLFEGSQSNRRDMFLHTWAGENPAGASKVLRAYFDAWFEAHPNQHPFERDRFGEFDAHSLGEMAKKAPEAFIEGTITAFGRSIDLITTKNGGANRDYTFKMRYVSEHHFGADAFLNMFRTAIRHVASTNSATAESFLRRFSPYEHEVCTHIWLETIAANGAGLGHMLLEVLDSPHLFHAGWQGAEWKSFADAANAAIPFFESSGLDQLTQLISGFNPELLFASTLLSRIRVEGEQEPWQIRQHVIDYLNRSGHDRWSVLETIGENLLSGPLKDQLQQLRRKFRGSVVSEPHDVEAHWVESPINRDKAVRMTDTQWLSAINRYDNDEARRRGRTFVEGGARQLAGELQHLAKAQPLRCATLLEKIPNEANRSYVAHLLWGLAEADNLDDEILRRALLNAHNRPNRPFGSEIARLLQKQPRVAHNPETFAILIWYIEHGDDNSDDSVHSPSTERELTTIEDLLLHSDRYYIRGINGTRGAAAEALGPVLWGVPEMMERAWLLLEQRANEEPLLSVRCCLIRPIVPLFNDDKERCAALAERLSRSPLNTSHLPTWTEKAWLCLAFPSDRLPQFLRRNSVWCARQVERISRKCRMAPKDPGQSEWWLPLTTHQGLNLFPFLLHWVPVIGRRLIYRLVITGDDISRMIGAWQIFRRNFQDAQYAPLADALAHDGVVYRRLLADIASHAVSNDEFRYRAEKVLQRSFNDSDKAVRSQAADVFRSIKPDEFGRYRELANDYLNSKAFEGESWAFFHALDEAECKVDDIVIPAAEKLIDDIKRNGNAAGRRSTDLHQLQDIIKQEYASSEGDPSLRRRLLDLIDSMLEFELYGVDIIIKAHER